MSILPKKATTRVRRPAFAALLAAVYLLLAALMYAEYWLLYSERKRQDLRLAWLLLVFPAFTFVTRCWNAVATLTELLTKSHLDSGMAPSWVLRRTKY